MNRQVRTGIRKNIKAPVCMVLACLLAFQTMIVPSAAAAADKSKEAPQEWYSYEEVILEEGSGILENRRTQVSQTLAEKHYYANIFTGIRYGDQILQLEELPKKQAEDALAIYNAMCEINPQTEALEIDLPNGITMKSTSASPSDAQAAEISAYIRCICQTAADAYVRDCPEDFWVSLRDTKWGYSMHSVGINGDFSIEIKKIKLTIGILAQCQPIATHVEQFEAAVKGMEVDQKDRYSLLKSIHDWLLEKNEFEAKGEYAYSAYGSLVDGQSVCEGYAEGFKVMCDTYGIPCVLVTGKGINTNGQIEDHMWNCVQMEDGGWYAVDAAWDDSNYEVAKYEYFLVGSKTTADHFDGKAFESTHLANGDFNGAGFVSFSYPEMEEQRYVYEGEITPGVSETPASSDPPASQPPVSEEPPVGFIYGDLDANKQVEVYDALHVLQAVVRLVTLDETQMLAADVSGDGAVAAADALLILQKVVELIDVFPVEQQ